jgi:hypothetical protein
LTAPTTTPAPAAPAGPSRTRRFRAILGYTFRSCFPPKRWLAIALPCVGALLFGLLAHALHRSTAERAFADVAA